MTLILNGTTGVSGVDGSAATPAFQGNDANTGISFGTDIVTINTGGQARVTTDASGNVGIGTVSNLASSKLDVRGRVRVGSGNSSGDAEVIWSNYASATSAWIAAVRQDVGGANNDLKFLRFDSSGSYQGVAMQIDSASGNVGIGTSSPASKLEVTGDVQQTWAASMDRFVGSKFSTTYELGVHFLESSRETRLVSKAADSTGLISFYTGVTPTEKMRINAAGAVGIGTASYTLVNKFDVLGGVNTAGFFRDADVTVVGAAAMTVSMGARSGSTLTAGAGIGAQLDNPATTGALLFLSRTAGALTEKARITTDGNLLVGTTTDNVATAGFRVISAASDPYLDMSRTGSASARMIGFYRNASGTLVGQISTTSTATTYSTSSDYRLKENVAPMTGALAKIAALKPVTYTWKTDGSDGQGFIAHELQAVVPDCVTGTKDAVDAEGKPQYQGVDTSFLVATLVAAIQELKAEVDALKGAQNV